MSSDTNLRVAARYLAALLAPKDVLKTFERYKSRLMSMIRDDSRAEEAKALYLEMAGELRPTALALEGMVIQRPDEARKLKNLKGWLRQLKSQTSPDRFKDAENDREVMMFISMSLDYLDDTLKSLARVQDRLQGYQQIEHKFTHGPYTITNNYGFRDDEYSKPLETLDAASDRVTKAGFSQAVYGDIILEVPSKLSKYAGMYNSNTDTISLNVVAAHRFDDVYTLVHELGHRVWYKSLSGTERDAYEDAYMGTTRALTVSEREQFWDALEKADFDPKGARQTLPDNLRTLFSAYWKEYSKTMLPPTPKNIELMGGKDRLRRQFIRPTVRYYVFDKSAPQSVTDYGQTNVKEDFAEVFAHYCMGMPLKPDAAERFRSATGKG